MSPTLLFTSFKITIPSLTSVLTLLYFFHCTDHLEYTVLFTYLMDLLSVIYFPQPEVKLLCGWAFLFVWLLMYPQHLLCVCVCVCVCVTCSVLYNCLQPHGL